MPIGPGKYDDLCTYVREKADAEAAIVIILGGNKGGGFSCQISDPKIMASLPELLEAVARDMRRAETLDPNEPPKAAAPPDTTP